MTEHRIADEAAGDNPRAIVYILTIDPQNCERLVKRIHETLAYEKDQLSGFLQARLLVSDDSTRIILESLWESRQEWSQSRWDEVIQKALVDLHQSSKSIDLKFYGRRELIT